MMNVYLCPYVVKDGGYREEDQVTSGGSYDLQKHLVITAASSMHAAAAAKVFTATMYSSRECKVKRPVLLGPAG